MGRRLTAVLKEWVVGVSFCEPLLVFVREVEVVKGEDDGREVVGWAL